MTLNSTKLSQMRAEKDLQSVLALFSSPELEVTYDNLIRILYHLGTYVYSPEKRASF